MLQNLNSNYFIAETAFHHEGDVNFLNELIDQLIQLDINAIKFHLLFDVTDYMVANHSAIDVIKKIAIEQEQWPAIFEKVRDANKAIIALTNDMKSLQYINKIQAKFPIAAIELHSTGLNDLFLLREALLFNGTVILGIGGSTFDEINFAVDFLKDNNKHDIVLMHGFQNYPTSYEDINFERIKLMKSAFGLPIGYADHTDPNDVNNALISVLPRLLDVKIFEKHVTHVFGEKRIDAQAAVSLLKMKDVIILGNEVEKTLGQKTMIMSEAELNYGNTGPMKKAIVARKDIKKGHTIELDDLAFKRTDDSSQLSQKDILKVIGSEVVVDIASDELISFAKIKYTFKKQSNDQFFINSK